MLVMAVLIISTVAPRGHADPADFRAMRGLWKITLHRIDRNGAVRVAQRWKCIAEDSDPWKDFADLPLPDARCQQVDRQRSSTSLSWNLRCRGEADEGHGRVDFDSPKHYRASVVLRGRGEVLQVEGSRMAACTDPSD
jgi:hypothetical protein